MPGRSRAPEPRPQPPMPVTVAEDGYHRTLVVTYLGEEMRVEYIGQEWQDDAEAWRHKPVAGLYYRVTLEGGQRLLVFKNMDHGGWYRR